MKATPTTAPRDQTHRAGMSMFVDLINSEKWSGNGVGAPNSNRAPPSLRFRNKQSMDDESLRMTFASLSVLLRV
jgi:hypothetical protein